MLFRSDLDEAPLDFNLEFFSSKKKVVKTVIITTIKNTKNKYRWPEEIVLSIKVYDIDTIKSTSPPICQTREASGKQTSFVLFKNGFFENRYWNLFASHTNIQLEANNMSEVMTQVPVKCIEIVMQQMLEMIKK